MMACDESTVLIGYCTSKCPRVNHIRFLGKWWRSVQHSAQNIPKNYL